MPVGPFELERILPHQFDFPELQIVRNMDGQYNSDARHFIFAGGARTQTPKNRRIIIADADLRRHFFRDLPQRARAWRVWLSDHDRLTDIGLRSNGEIQRNFAKKWNIEFFGGAAAPALPENMVP